MSKLDNFTKEEVMTMDHPKIQKILSKNGYELTYSIYLKIKEFPVSDKEIRRYYNISGFSFSHFKLNHEAALKN